MRLRRLGTSDVEVSAMALGSWQTYERISRAEGACSADWSRVTPLDAMDAVTCEEHLAAVEALGREVLPAVAGDA